MVFLTFPCLIRNRGPDRYWKVQELLKHARVRTFILLNVSVALQWWIAYVSM